MQTSKELYQERKGKHLCTKCGETAETNKTLCLHHLKAANRNQQAVIDRRKNKGLCQKCGTKLTNGRKTCNNCLEKNVSKHRDDKWIPWIDRKKHGLCINCGQPNSTSNQLCKRCSKKRSKTEQLTWKQRVANGLCGVCGKRLLANSSKTRCVICIYKHNKWYASSDLRKRRIKNDRLLRNQILKHYGGRCTCCGETEKTFLAIDHIYGKGNAHRKQINKISGQSYYKWIIEQNFPDYLQVLCYNCNMSKYLNGGICAHKSKQDGV